ncbi:expressed unknown protein [Seminavis robusta]|uniref:Uncharacterized protein n=1 Tax=Seminavis robusta TaxID=568900 RepID=A0A9N8E5A7_9STRA|nr:expressed unknown protein [Seminavis robusta]|eukprot:Sro666_g184060.1 n/a (201) ;mRNA; f:45754-46356
MIPIKLLLGLALCLSSLLDLSSGLLSPDPVVNRRDFWQEIGSLTASSLLLLPQQALAAGPSLAELQATTQKARTQLEAVPDIIKKEEWDRVRALLITPPLSDFWTTTKKGGNVLMQIADAVGDAGGDELQILELREDVQSHLRYLDMAVYNNVFNPITVEGTAGATKALVRSYYEDPINELKASVAAFDGILAEIANTGQ